MSEKNWTFDLLSHLEGHFSRKGEKSSSEDVDCDLFTRASVCPLSIDNVIMIDSKNAESEHQCQYKCFRDKQCQHFTYFAKGEIKKCVLFKECETMENCRYVLALMLLPDLYFTLLFKYFGILSSIGNFLAKVRNCALLVLCTHT